MKKQKNKQLKQVQNQAQEGRSMVEMLGVLAIIGVISLGGIAGYRWGMDKHVANQILYEMNLNSTQLAMLLQRGNADGVTLSLGSPYDEGKFRTVEYEFDYGCGESEADEVADYQCQPAETGYFMKATGLPKRVCNMLSDGAAGLAYASELEINDGADECDDTNNTVTVFFDTDTTVDAETPQSGESVTHTPTTEVTEAVTSPITETTVTSPTTTQTTTTTLTTTETTAANPCGEHGQLIYYSGGDPRSVCLCAEGYTGDWCEEEITNPCSGHGVLLYYSGGDPNEIGSFCYCEEGYAGERCEKQEENKECTSNEDCGANQYCCFSGSSSCTEQKGKGKCKSSMPDAKIEVNGKTFFAKFEEMNWWSAQNFCERNNKSMASISDLQCSSESKDQIKSGYGYCYKAGTSGELSDTIKGLYKKIGSDGSGYWLSDLKDSCNAYTVSLNNGAVNVSSRRYNAYALCE